MSLQCCEVSADDWEDDRRGGTLAPLGNKPWTELERMQWGLGKTGKGKNMDF